MNIDMMDIMNKDRYGFVSQKTELLKFKWTMYKYYKLYVEKKAVALTSGHYCDFTYRSYYNDYTDYLERSISRFRFLREIRPELEETYKRRIEKYTDEFYHPENINKHVEYGASFSEAINMIDTEMEKIREFF